tara:strand:+ start:235 stop:816 length:582 start_codon:yes stop_codon:yes gene_type:complete
MKNISILFVTLLILLILVNYYVKNKDLIILKGTDNRKYRLLDLPGKEKCLEMLVLLNNNTIKIIELLKKNKNEKKGINQVIKRYNPDTLSENLENRSLTAYSLNKGEQICICLREPKDENKIITDENTLMFVLIHELAHLMTEEIGHTDNFWKNMAFLLEKGNECGVYNPINYSESPVMYCGVNVNQTPYIFK